MSSFLDRWIYRDNQHSHNTGLKNGNTGSSYTKTTNMSSKEQIDPQYGLNIQNENTTPNLQNVPWSYYRGINTSRRGSDASDMSNVMQPSNHKPPRIVFSRSTVDNSISDHDGDENRNRNNRDSFHGNDSDDDPFSDLELMSINTNNHNLNSNSNKRKSLNIRRSLNSSRVSLDSNYKRLSIFNDNNETIEDKLADKFKSFKKKEKKRLSLNLDSNNTKDEENTNRNNRNNKQIKKSLKILIPENNSSNDSVKWSSNTTSPRLSSSRLNTPISLHHHFDKDQIADDFSSTLDDALFNSAWMPTKNNNNNNNNKNNNNITNKNKTILSTYKNSNSSNNSNLSIRRRKRKSIKSTLHGSDSNLNSRSNSFSFYNDLENNNSIPLENLNFNIPKIQIDNYMDNQSPINESPTNGASSFANNDNNNNNIYNMNKPDTNISINDIDNDGNSSSSHSSSSFNILQLNPNSIPPVKDNEPNSVTKVFAKISNLVNSDKIDLSHEHLLNHSSDNISYISNTDDDKVNNEFNTSNSSIDDIFNLDNNITTDRLNDDIDLESIYTYYMNETEHNNINKNIQDEIYPLDPFATKINNENISHNEYVTNLPLETTEYDDLPLFGKSLKTFGPNSKLRRSCYLILSYPAMNQVFTLMLIIQIGILSYQQWKVENGYVFAGGYTWVDWILFIFYVIYTIEMIGKMIAFGLYDDSEMIKTLKLQTYESELQKFYSKMKINLKNIKYFQSSTSNLKNKYNKLKEKFKSTKKDDNPSFVNLTLNENNDSKKSQLNVSTDELSSNNLNPKEINTMSIEDRYKGHPIHYALLRNEWNRLDFISIICFWISFFLFVTKKDIGKYQVFRSLMCLKILRLLNITKGSRVILKGLKDSAIQSKQVLILLVCFWVLLSIVGVESFKTSLRRHCIWTNPNNSTDTYVNEFQFCGSYLDPNTLTELPYIDERYTQKQVAKGFTCPVYSKCVMTDNPYNGRVSFDNIAESLQSVFVIMSANTFTDLMYYTMDSDSMVASLFFIISIFILTVWMINLAVAVIIHSYKAEDKTRKGHTSLYTKYNNLYIEFTNKSKIFTVAKKFDIIFIIIILIYFIFSCTKIRIDGKFDAKYNLCDFITSVIMMVEIICRLGLFIYAGNWRVFFYSIFNWVDLLSAVLSTAFSLPPVFHVLDTVVYGWLSVFGIIRFYRVVMFIKPIRKSWELALKRTRPFAELILFGAMLLYFVSIIMSRLFEGIVPESEMDDNQWIMYNLPNCIVSLFIITTTENWTDVLYTAEQYASNTFTSFCISIYLLSWFVISNTVLLSIFIAIITDNLELPETEKRISQIKQFVTSCVAKVKNNEHEGLVDLIKNKFDRNVVSDEATNFINRMNELLVANGQTPIDIDNFDAQNNLITKAINNLKNETISYFDEKKIYINTIKSFFNEHFVPLFTYLFKKMDQYSEDDPNSFTKRFLARLKNLITRFLHKPSDFDVTSLDVANPFSDFHSSVKKRSMENTDRSLFIFTNYNPIRRFCQMIVSPTNLERTEGRQPAPKIMYVWNVFMFLASVVVVVLACYETPLYRKSVSNSVTYNIWTVYADVFFMVIFSIEFFIKIIADGCIFGARAYFKSTWNILDFIVLVSFWVPVLSILNNNFSLLVTFGALRALRAFRLLTITKESKMVFHFAVISGAYKILSAAMVSLSLLIPFALWGLNIFSKELSYCADGVSDIENCSLEYYNEVFKWNIYSPNYVETPYLYFDSFSSSIQSLFEILSLEGWVDLLTSVVNITSYGKQPSIFASAGNGVFVIIFIFCSTVFIINLFISLIINNYALQTGVAFLNDDQYGWYEVKKVLSMVKPSRRRDDGELTLNQKKIFKFITEKKGIWSGFIKSILLIHFCLLISESYPYSDSGNVARSSLFVFTTLCLFVHMVLLQYSLGTRLFFSNKWNLIMMLVIVTALVLTCISFGISDHTVFNNINKAFLVAVLCFVIPQVDLLNQLIKYGSTSLFSLITLLYTWLVLFLVFAIALNQIFGLTRLGPNTTGNLNARTVTKALIMLFRNSFGEGWNQIMLDFEVTKPFCSNNGYSNSDCGSKALALLLFICWNILSMYIFLNILVSVVITNFSYIYHGSGPHKLITREEIRKFKRVWNKFDVNGSGYIYESDLFKFMHSLDGVLSYHVYPKYLSLPAIKEKVVIERDPYNGYDIEFNITRMEEILSFIDFRKVRRRRIRYERLISELLESSLEIAVDDFGDSESNIIRKIPFKKSLLVIGYYSRFEDSTCLNLEDFLRHSTQIKNINRELRKAKIVSTIKMIFTRLRYKFAVDKMKIIDKIEQASPLEKRRLKEELRDSLKGVDLSYEVLTDYTTTFANPENPIFNNNLYRVMSASSRNPFSDAYAANGSNESFISDEIR